MDSDSKSSLQVWCFICIAIICTIVAWMIMDSANMRMQKTHEIIFSHQEKSIELLDSLLNGYKKILSDTLIDKRDQAVESLCRQLSQITHDYGTSNNEDRISNLLETEFSKIQNEYEVLNLWCALLTIVFLIFSFFSIFKANEMANQSENSLKSMREIAHDVQTKSDEIDKEILKAKVKLEKVSNSIEQVSNDKESLANEIKSTKDTDLVALRNMINDLAKELDVLNRKARDASDRLNDEYNKREQEFAHYVESIKSNIQILTREALKEELTKSIDTINSQIDNLQTKYKELKAILEEFSIIDQMSTLEGIEDELGNTSVVDSERGQFDSDEDQSHDN